MMHRAERSRIGGAALVIAMLVAALAAAVAASLAISQQQWFATVSHRSEQVQAQALAQAGVQWARQILFEDARLGTLDHLGEPWALPLPATPIENGAIEGRIVDAQSLLNVNNLADTAGSATAERRQFERLFARLGLPTAALDAIADWVDADSVARPTGAEDAWYERQPAPLLTANAPLTRSAELAFVRGLSADTANALARYVTALPAGTKLNVNTALPAVLAAAVDGLDAGALPALVADRARKPFGSIGDFRSRLPSGASIDNEGGFAMSSDYFLVSVFARQGETRAQAHALLKRDKGVWPTIVWQTIE
jgi:general secretion pathway protein K